MDYSTSDCQLNQGEMDYEFESNEVPEPLFVVDDQFVPKVGMTFTTFKDAGKFYRNYAKAARFSIRVRSTNRKGNEIKNQLITYSREEKWKSKISPTEKTNPTAGLNCPGFKGLYANNNSPLVYLAQHEEDSKQIKRVQGTFDRNLNDFVLNFGLVDNKWLLDLYKDRHIWIPIYLDHHFWAGMRSTQRSESMHSFFNKFITWNSSLIQFVKQYNNCPGSREQAERESGAADFHTVIPCATKSSIEA
ncbi:hypothetical protein Ahy_A01g002203 [Arachis hypogaea]|uniref:Protein FAR1-RELATED SEQUENCE n=1 Tax=Arachis hypogaea TaxID=3818 RepID=A0A445EQT1_ARAHY|nr:hypothetical protein Ahy_A01g002203 [Arachis hypogaea]